VELAGLHRVERRLAAILAADVAGYSRLIEADEEGTLGRLKALRAEIIDPLITSHHGRIVKTTGDGLLVEFASVVDALRCAVEMQAALAQSNAPTPRTTASSSASVSMWVTLSSTMGTSLVTASTSPPGSKAWLIQAASAFRRAFKRTRQVASTSLSKTWASKRSRILRGPSGHIEWSGLPARH